MGTDKYVRIGSMEDFHVYDSDDYTESMEIDDPIFCNGTPTLPDHLAKLGSLVKVISVTDINDPTELHSYTYTDVVGTGGSSANAFIWCSQAVVSGADKSTLYKWDSETVTESKPTRVSGSAGTWIAVGGYCLGGNLRLYGQLEVCSDSFRVTCSGDSMILSATQQYDDILFKIYGTEILMLNGTTNKVRFNNETALYVLQLNASNDAVGVHVASLVTNTTSINKTQNADGTVSLDTQGSDTDFTVVTAIQAGGAGAIGIQYKTRALTLNDGLVTTVGNESSWVDV